MLVLQVTLLIALFYNAESNTGKIIGGNAARITSFPFMVSIRDKTKNNFHFCGGSIIDENYILSAAHCFKDKIASDLRVVIGTNSLKTGGAVYGVNRIIMHPGYNNQPHANDIAMLELFMPIVETKSTKKVLRYKCLKDGTNPVTAVGWGGCLKDAQRINSPILQYTTLQTAYNSYCKAVGGIAYGPNQICTLYPDRGTCFGDSGGPLLYNGYLIGISYCSDEFGCASIMPNVFTKVCDYESWIKSNQLHPVNL